MKRLFHTRIYKTGTKWCLWQWKDIKQDGEIYLTRLHIVQAPIGSICIHWIKKPDIERDLHDHPVSFLSILLDGWYREVRHKPGWAYTKLVERAVFNILRARPDDYHTIVYVPPGGAITLCLMGPNRRVWGFHTPSGWVSWKEYGPL